MKLDLAIRTDFSEVQLLKDEKNFIGIKIKDGRKNGAGIFIKKIGPKSQAAKSFAVAQGDVLVAVNGQATAEKMFEDVLTIISNAKSCVDLQLQYERQEIRLGQCSIYRKQQMTLRLHKEKHNFGFILRKKEPPLHSFCIEYPTICVIKERNRIPKNNQLQDGDRLLRVNDMDVSWLSLADIASLLQNKDEAQFTFEYKVRVIHFPESGRELDLEIDVPVSHFGLNFYKHADSALHIDSIQVGSVAERCGVFSEGDVIRSINGIDVKFLTSSKAEILLQKAKKTRKIVFSRGRQENLNIMSLSSLPGTSIISEDIDIASTESTSGVDISDWKHVNTPASSNIAFSVQQNYYSEKFYHTEQMKAIDRFQDIVSDMSSMKCHLSRLTHEAFNARHSMLNQNCTLCNKERHAVKLCTSCLSKLNVKCAESMRLLRSIIAHFVSVSTQSTTDIEERDICDHQSIKVSTNNIVVALTETLPKAFEHMPELQEPFSCLAEKIRNVDTSCGTCEFEVKYVMLIVQKLLLLISLRDCSDEILDLIELLVKCLLDARFTCDAECEHACSPAESDYNVSTSDNIKNSDRSSLRDVFKNPPNSIEAASSETQSSAGSISDIPQLNTDTNPEYLKIAHIQNSSDSQNAIFENQVAENNAESTAVLENQDTCTHKNERSSFESSVSKDPHLNENKGIHEEKGLKLHQKIWKSLESFLRPRRNAKSRTVIRNASQITLNGGSTSEFSEVNPELLTPPSNSHRSSINDRLPREKENVSHASSKTSFKSPSTDRTNTHFKTYSQVGVDRTQRGRKRVRTETVNVKLRNDGSGFGLDIALKPVKKTSSFIIVINSIKPNSPSQKVGTLKMDDRVIAINHQSTLGLSADDLIQLSKEAFSADLVILAVEFDVIDEDPKFGTFDVVLERTLKAGMYFEDMKKGSPMTVSSVVRGSAAHRSGQIYTGDEIILFKSIRSNEFNPISGKYSKVENLKLTVRRHADEETHKKTDNASSVPCNPFFRFNDSSRLNGTTFILKSTTVRAVKNSEALAYEQNITLFRDSVNCDFGFLLGEHVDNGNAYISDIRPESPAHLCGVIKKFDRILKINGVTVNRNVGNSALALLSQANDKVDLLIRRIYHENPKLKEATSQS